MGPSGSVELEVNRKGSRVSASVRSTPTRAVGGVLTKTVMPDSDAVPSGSEATTRILLSPGAPAVLQLKRTSIVPPAAMSIG